MVRGIALLSTFATLLSLATSPLAAKKPKLDLTEPVAAAIREAVKEHSEYQRKQASGGGEVPYSLVWCIDTEAPLDFAMLERRLAGTFIRAVPEDRCTMAAPQPGVNFPPPPDRLDETGEPAWLVSVTVIKCSSRPRCIVDIASSGGGGRYTTERGTNGWTVTRIRNRWVV